MKNRFYQLAGFALALTTSPLHSETMNLAGEWKMAFDPKDHGVSAGPGTWNFPDAITLPNTTARAGMGEKSKIEPSLQDPWVRYLHQKHLYIGPAWYQKKITVPADWKGKDVVLTLERVLWESRVWVNKKPVGKPEASLSVPHRYDLTGFLTPGEENTITLRIDNRQIKPMGDIGHAYTHQTQSIWNGVVGKIQLEALPKVRVSHIKVRPNTAKKKIHVLVEVTNNTGKAISNQAINLAVGKDKPIRAKLDPVVLKPGVSKHKFAIDVRDSAGLEKWSEFTPVKHPVTARLSGHAKTVEFGYRSMTTDGRKILVNGSPIFMRGNLECCIFPNTGHPDMTGEQWEKIFKTAREWGLNHFRFHSWCPPKVAFEMADKYGMYLQVELPNWTFKMGQIPKLDKYFIAEGERIFREYGNHPSFVMLSLGNELKGDFAFMDKMITDFRKIEPHLLYTSTAYSFSNRGLVAGPEDDFFITQRSKSGWVRGQGFLNDNFPSTDTDYAKGLKSVKVPLVTHEVGQYHVFPDLRELKKYADSPLRPTAWEAIRDDLEKKNRLDLAARYTRDSGKLSARLYKEDMERALRTPGLSGIQLLQLQDFPGQGTATVGLLDSFWDNKGVIEPEEFRRFNSPTVPLVRMEKFVWENDETFTAEVEVAHFGAGPLKSVTPEWSVKHGDSMIAKGKLSKADIPVGNGTSLGTISVPLKEIKKAAKLTLTVRLGDDQNSWSIWVYPSALPESKESRFVYHRALTENVLEDLKQGKRVLLNPPSSAIIKSLAGRFIPVFWSPVHFQNQPASIGATILADHPCWSDFPTDTHTDWQWWELTAKSTSVDLEGIAGIDPRRDIPFAYIDKFNRNALPAAIFEAQVGSGKLLVCTLDITTDLEKRYVARQLRQSLTDYISSDQFKPQGKVSPAELQTLFGETNIIATANSENGDFPAELAVDGKASTFWHSDWSQGHRLPVSLSLDLLREKPIKGFNYVPRQDMPRGRIKNYRIEISRDGKKWVKLGSQRVFPAGRAAQKVMFKKPVKTRYLRLVALSEQGGNSFAGAAEFMPIEAALAEADDLGIIPGFND